MPDRPVQYTRVFEENINILFDELKLGIQWDRPSILLAIYKLESGKEKIEKALSEKLQPLGQRVVSVQIGKERPGVFPSLLQTANRDKTIFLISNIDRGGRDAYRALNIHREFLVENKIRAVFLLSPDEASNLPNLAPDFWAFRHRVIEFTGSHPAPQAVPPSGILIWHAQQDSTEPPTALKEKIASRESLLRQLSADPEALSARSELLYSLGHLYWMQGNSSSASKSLTSGLDLTEKFHLPHPTWFLNGLAVIHYEDKNYKEASDICRKALEKDSRDGFLCINASATACALGQNLNAITMGRQAVKINPADARLWNSFGHIHVAIGKLDEAITCFIKAVEIAPAVPNFVLSLAIGYKLTNDPNESIRQLKTLRTMKDASTPRLEACEKILLGNKAEAIQVLRAALRSNQISKVEVRRDPNIRLILDPAEIESLLM